MTESATVSERDIGAIQFGDWPHRDLTDGDAQRQPRFQVVFLQSVVDEIHLHGQGGVDAEVCGVLIGTGHRDARGPYMLIEHCIRGDGATSKSTNVTFTADTWRHIQDAMDRLYPDKKMVGWYHTHPGFGIFLSDMDVFICDNFFNFPWQSAFVYDPRSGTQGNFIWRNGKPESDPILVEDDVTPKSAQIPLPRADAPPTTHAPSPTAGQSKAPARMATTDFSNKRIVELEQRVHRLEKRQTTLYVAMIFLVAFSVMWAIQYAPSHPSPPAATQPSTQPASTPGPQSPEILRG